MITKVRSDSGCSLVADIETLLNENLEHVPYAAGVMKVDPSVGLKGIEAIHSWFSEDYPREKSFEKRSRLVLNRFIDYIVSHARD
jgi:hypothetical protein